MKASAERDALVAAFRDKLPLPTKIGSVRLRMVDPPAPFYIAPHKSVTRRVHRPRHVVIAGKTIGARMHCGAWNIGGRYEPRVQRGDGLLCIKCAHELTPGGAVYRCFGRCGDLLYIGSTKNPYSRLRGHANSTPWWGDVASVTVETYQLLHEARAAETAAILAESPWHNVRLVPISMAGAA